MEDTENTMDKQLPMVGFVILVCLVLGGCTPATRMSAQMDVLSSKTKYKDCLITNPNDHSKCEVLRKLYEIDKEAVEAVGSFLP